MATCSHVWKDKRYMAQLVHNHPIAPWDMKPGQTYECVNCHCRIYMKVPCPIWPACEATGVCRPECG